jgi:hypothetical protein
MIFLKKGRKFSQESWFFIRSGYGVLVLRMEDERISILYTMAKLKLKETLHRMQGISDVIRYSLLQSTRWRFKLILNNKIQLIYILDFESTLRPLRLPSTPMEDQRIYLFRIWSCKRKTSFQVKLAKLL